MTTSYRRAQHHRGRNHVHLNRAARTDAEGHVQRCLFCAPLAHDNEKIQQHGVLRFRPVQGKLRWAGGVLSKPKQQEE